MFSLCGADIIFWSLQPTATHALCIILQINFSVRNCEGRSYMNRRNFCCNSVVFGLEGYCFTSRVYLDICGCVFCFPLMKYMFVMSLYIEM